MSKNNEILVAFPFFSLAFLHCWLALLLEASRFDLASLRQSSVRSPAPERVRKSRIYRLSSFSSSSSSSSPRREQLYGLQATSKLKFVRKRKKSYADKERMQGQISAFIFCKTLNLNLTLHRTLILFDNIDSIHLVPSIPGNYATHLVEYDHSRPIFINHPVVLLSFKGNPHASTYL